MYHLIFGEKQILHPEERKAFEKCRTFQCLLDTMQNLDPAISFGHVPDSYFVQAEQRLWENMSYANKLQVLQYLSRFDGLERNETMDQCIKQLETKMEHRQPLCFIRM